jgi:hypothetical protein
MTYIARPFYFFSEVYDAMESLLQKRKLKINSWAFFPICLYQQHSESQITLAYSKEKFSFIAFSYRLKISIPLL